MVVRRTPIPGLLLVEPKVFPDARGAFTELFHAARYAEHGIPGPAASFVQVNHTRSVRGALRGLHFQEPNPQAKLVQALSGSVYDVVVDLRRGSPTFKRWYAVELSDENHRQLWIPPGLAHGLCVLSERADFLYQCTALYSPETERSIIWNDPDLAIPWPVAEPILSKKDAVAPPLADLEVWPVYPE